MARTLTKVTSDGSPYVRPPDIEQQIDEVLPLGITELRQRLSITDKDAESHLRSETMVHLVRTAVFESRQEVLSAVFPVLLARCESNLNAKILLDRSKQSWRRLRIRRHKKMSSELGLIRHSEDTIVSVIQHNILLLGRVSGMNRTGFSKLTPKVFHFLMLACLCFIPPGLQVAFGQSTSITGEAAEWRTSSVNPQRDGWQRNESKLTTSTAKDIRLLWKVKTDNVSMGMQSFREPLIIADVNTRRGIKTLAILAGSSNDVYAIDADSGEILWQKHLKWSSEKPQAPEIGDGFICTKALTATPVVTPAGAAERFAYVLSTDGYLHTLNLSTGDENRSPLQMLPAIYGKAYGLNLSDNVIYTVTGQGCYGVPNKLYAVDLTNGKAFSSAVGQGGIFGTAGPAIGTDGTIYFETGDGSYDPAKGQLATTVMGFSFADDTLALKDYYTPSNHEWLTIRDLDMNVTPVVFPYKGRELLVESGKEGRYFLMDARSLGGLDHETPLYRSPLISNTNVNFQTEGTWGSLASWESQNGARWVLAPIGGPVAVPFPISYGATPNGGVIAMRLTDTNGKLELIPAWLSCDMMTAEPPVVANGVVFVLAAGEFTGQANDVDGGLYSWQDRVKRSIPAKLYALDAETGKELYSSGDQVTSFLHQSGIAVAGGRVIFGTFDGTIYCFGVR